MQACIFILSNTEALSMMNLAVNYHVLLYHVFLTIAGTKNAAQSPASLDLVVHPS